MLAGSIAGGYFFKNGWYVLLGLIVGIIAGVILFFMFLFVVRLFSYRYKDKNKPFKFGVYLVDDFANFAFIISLGTLKRINFDKIPQGGYFLVMNHQSNLDVLMVLGRSHNHNLCFVMKDSLGHLPIAGKMVMNSGFIALNRDDPRDGVRMLSTATKRIKAGYPIAICPEGTRSKTPEMNDFHVGTFKIPQKAQCPIVIVATDGFWRYSLSSRPATVKSVQKVIEVLDYETYKDWSTQELEEYCYNKINNELTLLRQEYPFLQMKKGEREKLILKNNKHAYKLARKHEKSNENSNQNIDESK